MEIESGHILGQVSQGSLFLDEKPPDGCAWSRRRLTRKQTTSRPDTLWPESWKDMSEASKRKEKQKWAIEKLRLDKAGKLRGIYFIDPPDEELKEITTNACRKLEVPIPAAMPCRIRREKFRETCSVEKNCKTKYSCIVEADESTRKRMEGSLYKDHEDHVAGKGMHSLSHYNLVHKFILMLQGMKIPDAKVAVEKEWETLEKIPAWQLTQVRNKKEVIAAARNEGRTVHFASLLCVCHLKNSELEPKIQKYKGRVVLRGDIVNDDSGSCAVFTEQG